GEAGAEPRDGHLGGRRGRERGGQLARNRQRCAPISRQRPHQSCPRPCVLEMVQSEDARGNGSGHSPGATWSPSPTKVLQPVGEQGTQAASSSVRTVAWARARTQGRKRRWHKWFRTLASMSRRNGWMWPCFRR